jgi:hypothetical protein
MRRLVDKKPFVEYVNRLRSFIAKEVSFHATNTVEKYKHLFDQAEARVEAHNKYNREVVSIHKQLFSKINQYYQHCILRFEAVTDNMLATLFNNEFVIIKEFPFETTDELRNWVTKSIAHVQCSLTKDRGFDKYVTVYLAQHLSQSDTHDLDWVQ